MKAERRTGGELGCDVIQLRAQARWDDLESRREHNEESLRIGQSDRYRIETPTTRNRARVRRLGWVSL